MRLLRAWIAILVFLAPLKFGIVVGGGESGVFPLGPVEWLLSPWPAFLLPALAGFGLLASLVIHPEPPWQARPAVYPLAWLLLATASLVGLIRATDLDFACLYIWHLAGVACMALLVFRAAACDPRLRGWLLAALAAGTAVSLFRGWSQVVGGGFQETIEFARNNTPGGLEALPPALLSRMQDNRAFADFVYPNSFAAHLLLAGPIFMLCFWRFGGRLEPARVGRPLFLLAAAIFWGGGLWLSGSRAAFLALAISLFITLFCLPLRPRWRLGGMVTAGLSGVLLIVLLSSGRGPLLASVAARGVYWQCATQMFAAHPLTGAGLGEFFHEYIRIKPPGAEETRLPHSMFFNAASQSGLLAALAAAGCILAGLAVHRVCRPGAGQTADGPLLLAVQTGSAAWCLHAMADFNLLIPGTVMLVPVLPMLGCQFAPAATGNGAKPHRRPLLPLAGQLGLALLAGSAVLRMPGGAAFERFYRSLTQASHPVSWETLQAQAGTAMRRLPLAAAPAASFAAAAAATGRLETAADAYIRAVALSPHNAAYHARLAEVLARQGRLEEARAAVRRALYWYPEKKQYQQLAESLGLRRAAPP